MLRDSGSNTWEKHYAFTIHISRLCRFIRGRAGARFRCRPCRPGRSNMCQRKHRGSRRVASGGPGMRSLFWPRAVPLGASNRWLIVDRAGERLSSLVTEVGNQASRVGLTATLLECGGPDRAAPALDGDRSNGCVNFERVLLLLTFMGIGRHLQV